MINEIINSSALPKGWVFTELSDILAFVKGKKPQNIGAKSKNFKYLYINIEAFEKNIFKQFTDNNNYPYCKKDDILIVWDGARCGLVGRGVEGVIGSTLAKLEYYEINGSYLYYFLKTKYGYINKRPRGVGIPHIEPDIFWNINFPLSPLPEQHLIVAKIEELFTKLDAGVGALKKVREQIKRYRQAVLKYAFEGKLTEEWCKENKDRLEPASVLLQKIKEERKKKGNGRYKELPPTDKTELPELPEGWEWTRLYELTDIINPGFPTGKHNKDNKGIPHIRPMNINIKGNIDLNNTKYIHDAENYDKLLKGDVLFNNTNSPELLGKTTYIKYDTNWAYSNHMTRIRFNTSLINSVFIAKYLNYLFYKGFFLYNCIHHVNQASINTSFLSKNVLIPFTSIIEQNKIVEEIERLFSIADEVEKIIEQNIRQAEKLRQSILKRAFEGKLVPQDPNDEPAEKLLERIKEEKNHNVGARRAVP